MRVLFALILTYNIYFIYMIYEVFKLPKLNTIKTVAVDVPKNIVSINDIESQSYNERNYSDIYMRSCYNPIQRFAGNRVGKVKTVKSTPQWYHCKSVVKDSRIHFHASASKIYRRKLLGHEQTFLKHPMRPRKSQGIHREITATRRSEWKEKRNIAKNTESYNEDTDSEAWDNWNNWSACSVTCGQGRQVRWRHCISENCIKGLKKAQLKNCHLKDCGNKTFLEWLGIKT